MSDADELKVDPNSASGEELRQLPGIGPELATRIIEARPYESAEDLRKVAGLGDNVLADIEPYLIFKAKVSVSSTPPKAETGSPQSDRAAAKVQKYPLAIAEPRSRTAGFWALLATGAASIFCSVTLTLAVLVGINGTLDFGRTTAMQDTRGELLQIRSQLESTQVELDALRGRAEALEGMSGRMSEVESQVAELQQQTNDTIALIDAVTAELTSALEETRAQAERVKRFETFLEGLSRLIGQVTTEP